MKNESLKEVVREMCSATNGGREVMAGALGMSVTSFNNRFYEKNGCRFFDHHDLMTMQEVSGTVLYAEFVAAASNRLLVEKIEPEDLDETELHRLRGIYDLKLSDLIIFTHESLKDGVIDSEEEKGMDIRMERAVASGRSYYIHLKALHKVGE
ncbi:YmfL family putative regulatory protein [Morganella morganii]|nr:hypothetical protein [Morganella morganii]HEI8515184.1 hypothetical protein [Morganella morganii]